MKNNQFIILSILCLIISCKEKTKNIHVSKKDTSQIEEVKEIKNKEESINPQEIKLVVLKSESAGKEFLVTKEIKGEFMIDQDYSEQLIVNFNNCTLTSPKTIGQSKIKVFSKTLNYGDWDNDKATDWEFIYRINEDGLDYVINYVIISSCQLWVIENVFYEDEDTFQEEYEEEISHISNIKGAHDYYIRNFNFQIEELPKMNKDLKSQSMISFKKFVETNGYAK